MPTLCDPAIPLKFLLPELKYKVVYTRILIVALFVVARDWKTFQCPSLGPAYINDGTAIRHFARQPTASMLQIHSYYSTRVSRNQGVIRVRHRTIGTVITHIHKTYIHINTAYP